MKIRSMKLTPPEAKAEVPEVEYKPPEYPYGLCLYLDEEIIKKLGISKNLDEFEIDERVSIQGFGRVTGLSMRKFSGDEERRSLDIQITDLGIAADSEDEAGEMPKTVGGRLYGKDD